VCEKILIWNEEKTTVSFSLHVKTKNYGRGHIIRKVFFEKEALRIAIFLGTYRVTANLSISKDKKITIQF